MITEYIRYHIDRAEANAFEAAYAQAVGLLAASPHCVDYDLARCSEDPSTYILRITWDSMRGHLEGFRTSAQFREFFAHVRPYVDGIDEMRHYEPVLQGGGAARSADEPPSLYEWAGGGEGLEAVFTHFYDTVLTDDLLYPLFKDMADDHPQRVAAWVGEVFGGPARYTTERGGHPEMLRHHLDRGITEQQRRRWIDLLVDATDAVGLADDPEFRAAFMGYIEWGTRLAKLFSQPGAAPNFDEPVPSWDWSKPPWQD